MMLCCVTLALLTSQVPIQTVPRTYLVDFVSSSHEKSGKSRCSDGRADSIPPHFPVDTSVPLSPGLGRSEHAATPTHVTVGSLTGPVSTATSDTRNTSYSSASSPGFSTSLVTGFFRYGISLKMIGVSQNWETSKQVLSIKEVSMKIRNINIHPKVETTRLRLIASSEKTCNKD